MSSFWEIKTRDYYWAGRELKKYIPELKNVDSVDIASNLRGSDLTILSEISVKRPAWIRFTLPFAFIFLVILLVSLPFKFMFIGNWRYQINWITNWFRAVGF